MPSKINILADVQTVNVGDNTAIWQFCVVLAGAKIGSNCNINCHTFIENDVVIGDNVTVKSGVYLWDGISVEDNVFIGPNVTFTNDRYPRSKVYPGSFQKTSILKGASIGANATILGGLIIGAFSLIGAGAVVTRDVPNFAIVYGNPGKVTGWLDQNGHKLKVVGDILESVSGQKFKVQDEKLIEL